MTAHLRRRDDGALELRVNGVFVMDDAETGSERLLARLALDHGARSVLVGGLGLGFTLRELLADSRVERIVVAELEPEIVAWMTDGTIPGAELLADPRTRAAVGDVRTIVADQPPASLDAILLDVDNGPDFLVHEHNAEVYSPDFLRTCASRLRTGGLLGVWSMSDSLPLRTALAEEFAQVRVEQHPVRLQERDETYWVFAATAQGTMTS